MGKQSGENHLRWTVAIIRGLYIYICEMAQGALSRSRAMVSLSVTGEAGLAPVGKKEMNIRAILMIIIELYYRRSLRIIHPLSAQRI